MISLLVNSDSGSLSAYVTRLRLALRGTTASRVLAEAGADLTREHLYGLASSRHRKGQGLNFYARAADAVVAEPVSGGAEVTIPHVGLALRYFGGTVRASGRISQVTGRPIRMLAIPKKGSEAEGKTPGEFGDLFVVASRRSGKAVLAGRKANGMVAVLFFLTPKTTHKPDKSVLPTDAAYLDACKDALTGLLEETN